MKLRIFVIDDDELIRDSIRLHLENDGHEVLTAEEPMVCDIYHGCDCREAFPCGDMLLIDQQMPRMTGLEFIEYMTSRGCKGNPANKFIITGNPAGVDGSRVARIGCNLLRKPLYPEQLDQLVQQVRRRLDPNRQLTPLSTIMSKSAQAARQNGA